MVYVLATNYVNGEMEAEDVVEIASTKITDILDYLWNRVQDWHYSDYQILIMQERERYLGGGIIPTYDVYGLFTKFPPQIFCRKENEEEYEYVKEQLRVWCEKVHERHKRRQEEQQRKRTENKEKQERELYEKLKAKYGD